MSPANGGEGQARRRSSDRTPAVTLSDELVDIKRRLQYLDGNGVDPGRGAIGRRKQEIAELREDMERKDRELRMALTTEITPLKRFDDKMKLMFWLICLAIAGSWGGLQGAIKIVKAISEAVR